MIILSWFTICQQQDSGRDVEITAWELRHLLLALLLLHISLLQSVSVWLIQGKSARSGKSAFKASAFHPVNLRKEPHGTQKLLCFFNTVLFIQILLLSITRL
jgi:hypothetical protein